MTELLPISRPPVPLTGDPLDRGDALRKQGDIADVMARPNAVFVVLMDAAVLVLDHGGLALLNAAILDHCSLAVPPIFLGLEGETDTPWFALHLQTGSDPAMLDGIGQFMPLRAAMGVLPPDQLAIAARCHALGLWHMRNGYCPNCGNKSEFAGGGEKRHCASCERDIFPRVDPAVIMMVVDGDDCLLGRQSHWGPGHYSLLAGFVEPGESFEEACRREVMEEAGVNVGRVAYAISQPWPFPHSIMIGQFAEAVSREIVLEDELENAIWVSRDDVRAMLAGIHADLRSPFPGSASKYLMEMWADGYDPFAG